MIQEFDAIVVGTGISGGWAAKELTEKGLNLMTTSIEDKDFFILPDVGKEIVEIEKSNVSDEEKASNKESLLRNFSIKSERIHTVNQLLKAYTLFEKDVEYVVIDNKVKIVDEQTGRIMDGRRYSDGLHQAIEAKENVPKETTFKISPALAPEISVICLNVPSDC